MVNIDPKILKNKQEISNAQQIANKFNNYFVNVGQNLAKAIPVKISHSLRSGLLHRISIPEKHFKKNR